MLQRLVQDARQADPPLHWLDLQDANRYKWVKVISQDPTSSGRTAYYRRQGIVEGLFDSDGTLSCGRADLHQSHIYEIRTSLNDDQLRERIVLAWTLMRVSHVLLSTQSVYLDQIVPRAPSRKWSEKCFLYRCPRSLEEAIDEARQQVRFVEESYSTVDRQQFFLHILNTNRAIDSNTALARLHVLPFESTNHGTIRVDFLPVVAHQITDGITVYRWASHFAKILNMPSTIIKSSISTLIERPDTTIPPRLPPPQESLYPARSSNLSRQRWHWLLTRVLRHVRTPLPPAFQNPLRRTITQRSPTPFPPTYKKVLDYNTTPPLNAGHVTATVTYPNTQKLRSLCKKARISVGSGLFTLVAISMMTLEERRNPTTELHARLPFIGSFPVNPRPFLSTNTTGVENSCMLAFSDGVVLPFLPTYLDLAGRFNVLGRLAHRQLRQYQKRTVSGTEEVMMGSRSPSQLLPALFCGTLERLEGRYDTSQKAGVNVQGAYPAAAGGSLATCGVSSVGDVAGILAVDGDGKEGASADVDRSENGDQDVVAKLEYLTSVVRPRDGEFLVGAIGDSRKDEFMFSVSFDANAIDDERVWEWKGLMEGMLDKVDVAGDNETKAKL